MMYLNKFLTEYERLKALIERKVSIDTFLNNDIGIYGPYEGDEDINNLITSLIGCCVEIKRNPTINPKIINAVVFIAANLFKEQHQSDDVAVELPALIKRALYPETGTE